MGIRIDGAADLINATDGSLTIEGQSVNTTGIITASGGMKVGSAATIHSTGQFNIGVAATIFANGNATFSGITTFGGNINANGNIVGDNSTDISGINDVTISMLSISDTITHTGDTNTKIRFPNSDVISLETAGAENMRVASGIVAIGTETTSGIGAKLRVGVPFLTQAQDLSDGGMIFVPSTGATVAANQVMPGIIWSGQGSGAGIARAGIAAVSTNGRSAMDLCFMTRSQADGTALKVELDETMRLISDNRIGIGTTISNAGSKITISGADSDAAITIKNFTTSDSSGARKSLIKFQGTQSGGEVSDLVHLAAMHDGGADDQYGAFRVYINDGDDDASPTERFGIGRAGEYRVNQSIGSAGQVIKSAGSGSPAVWGDMSGGIDVASAWRVTSDASGNQTPMTSWELVDTYGGGGYGSAMSESSGIFTFPSTGWWWICLQLNAKSDNHSQNVIGQIDTTTDNSSYSHTALAQQGIYDFNNSYPSHANAYAQTLFDVTSTTNCKVRFSFGAGQGNETVRGSSTYSYTNVIFIRLGDT